MAETPADLQRVDDFRVELGAVSAAVREGNTDLSALGFWKLVARAKRNPILIRDFADEIGAIDREAFEERVDVRFPVGFGNLILLAEIVGGFVLLWFASYVHGIMAGLCFVAAAVVLAIGVHCPAHWVVGRLVHIQFTWYFIGGPFPQRPGLKIDYASYLRAKPEARSWMHASGALATKLMPFLVLALYRWTNAPVWAALVVLLIGWGQILTDVVFSTRTSDWKKVRREVRIANELKAKRA